jgi:hypothetical protein
MVAPAPRILLIDYGQKWYLTGVSGNRGYRAMKAEKSGKTASLMHAAN